MKSTPRLERAAVAVFDNYWATTLAFARSLGRRGIKLNFYGSGAGRWSRYSSKHRACPEVDDARAFLPWLREKVRSGEITRVAPTTDLIAYYLSVLRDEFAPEVRRSIAPLNEIENCLIKTRFAKVTAQRGDHSLAVAEPYSVESALSAAAAIGYPLMMKPKSHLAIGMEDRGRVLQDEMEVRERFRACRPARGQDQIAASYPELGWPLLQRYLPRARKRVYSVSGFKDAESGVVVATVSYKSEQWPPDVGVSTVQVAVEDERILEAGRRVVDQVLSRGIFEVELIEDGGELFAIDLNPRAFGFIELDIARGADLPWLWYQSTYERQYPFTEPVRPREVEARHRFRHLLNSIARLRSRTASRDGTRRTESRASISMVGHWSDPLPMMLSNLQLLKHPRSLLRSQFASLQEPRHEPRTV